MVVLFGSFGAKSFFGRGKYVCYIGGNPNSLEGDNFFFPNLFKLCILMDFYLVLLRVCPRFLDLMCIV
jgi:hypothetical protein